MVVKIIDVKKGYSFRRQFSTREQKATIMKEIVDLIDDAIFIGGTAYIAHMLDVIKDPKKLRYQKDIDFFTKDRDKAIKILEARGYSKRSEPIMEGVKVTDKYAKYDTQRRKTVGKIKLKIPEEKKDGTLVYEIPVGVGVDIISKNYYSQSFPDPEKAVKSLIRNAKKTDAFGFEMSVQDIEDFVVMKLLNMERAFKGEEKVIYNRDVYDVLNLIYALGDDLDFSYISDLIGGKDILREKLEKARRKVVEPKSEIDETLVKLITVQEIRNLDANPVFLIDDKKKEIDMLDSVIEDI